MPRRKISEYRAKRIVTERLGIGYIGWPVRFETMADDIEMIDHSGTFVVKVDQAVKGRFKKGLVAIDVSKDSIADKIRAMHEQGYEHFLVEPFVAHEQHDERYLSLSLTKSGIQLSSSMQGGINVEDNAASIHTITIDDAIDWHELSGRSGWSEEWLRRLVSVFTDEYFAFLEINPYLLQGDQLSLLDLAVEVDDAAALMVDSWSADDMRQSPRTLTDEEQAVARLDEKSPASFNLQVMNPDGAVFLLLSGGGASVTVADEMYSAGYGKQLANYGEYSGNPTEDETFLYADAVLRLLLRSHAPKKVLFIGGAVANFTDIAKTFAGIIRAIHQHADELMEQEVKIFVRRGGPNQEKGLQMMRNTLVQYGLLGGVYDQRVQIGQAVAHSLRGLE
jgi:succinyl-CoA synthetase beta subunit